MGSSTAFCPLLTAHCPLAPTWNIHPDAVLEALWTAASRKAMPATPSAMPGWSNGSGRRLAAGATDGPFEGAMQVRQGLVEAFGMAGGEPHVGLGSSPASNCNRPPGDKAGPAGRMT